MGRKRGEHLSHCLARTGFPTRAEVEVWWQQIRPLLPCTYAGAARRLFGDAKPPAMAKAQLWLNMCAHYQLAVVVRPGPVFDRGAEA